jgi:hypothetical protein
VPAQFRGDGRGADGEGSRYCRAVVGDERDDGRVTRRPDYVAVVLRTLTIAGREGEVDDVTDADGRVRRHRRIGIGVLEMLTVHRREVRIEQRIDRALFAGECQYCQAQGQRIRDSFHGNASE